MEKNGIELHRALYYPLKADFRALVSDLHIQARVKATEAVKSALALRRKYAREQIKRKVSQPHSAACPPRYNLHTYRIDWDSRTVRLSTTTGRMTIGFSLPAYAERYAALPTDTADLIHRDGGRWLHGRDRASPGDCLHGAGRRRGIGPRQSRRDIPDPLLGQEAVEGDRGTAVSPQAGAAKEGQSIGQTPPQARAS
jgi:hypothetical protein